MRWLTTRLATLALFAATTAAATAQRPVTSTPAPSVPSSPAPGGPGGGPGGPGGMRFPGGPGGPPPDADMIWGFMSQGSDTIDVNKRPEMRSRLERSRVTIPANGIVTKAAFKEAFDKRQAEREAERAARGGGPGGPPVVTEAPQVVFQPPPEQPQPQPGPGGPPGGKPKTEEREKPFVSRFGNLPKEAPSFFVEYDDDEDGMVGLYEWRRHKKPIAEFVPMDLNGDGLLTPDEHLRFETARIAKLPDGKDKGNAAGRDRREARSGGRTDSPRGKDGGPSPARPAGPGGERPSRGQRPDDKSTDRPAAASPNPFTGK